MISCPEEPGDGEEKTAFFHYYLRCGFSILKSWKMARATVGENRK